MTIKDLPKSLGILSLKRARLSIISEGNGEGECYKSNLKTFEVYKTEIIGNSLLQLSHRHFSKLNQYILIQNDMEDLLSLPDQRFSLVKIITNGQCLKLIIGNGRTLYYEVPRNETLYRGDYYQFSNYIMHPVHEPTPVIDSNEKYLHFQCKSVQNLIYNNCLLLV